MKLCTVLVHASGYRPEKTLQHYRTIQALSLVLGRDRETDVEYLDTCRAKRNTVEYDRAGDATEDNADELIEFTKTLRQDVIVWLQKYHPGLLPPGESGTGRNLAS